MKMKRAERIEKIIEEKQMKKKVFYEWKGMYKLGKLEKENEKLQS